MLDLEATPLQETLQDMLQYSTPVEQVDIPSLIEKLQTALGLQHWTIGYVIVVKEDLDKMGKSLMRIVPSRERRKAKLYIRPDLVGKPLSEFGPLLLHELLHLVLDPIFEEYSLQTQYELAESRVVEYSDRLLRQLERTIEHLTTTISRLLPNQE